MLFLSTWWSPCEISSYFKICISWIKKVNIYLAWCKILCQASYIITLNPQGYRPF